MMTRRGFALDTSCKLYLPFYRYGSEQSGIRDMSGNNNHGTISGAIPSSHIPIFGTGNKVINGTFTGDSDWTKGTGWAITTVATKTFGTASNLEQNINVVAGKKYLLYYTLTRTAGSITPQIGDIDGTVRSVSGSYYGYYNATSTGNLKFQADSSFAGTVDNVSVSEVSGFTGGNGWYFDGVDDKVTVNHSTSINFTNFTILFWVRSLRTAPTAEDLIIKEAAIGASIGFGIIFRATEPLLRIFVYDTSLKITTGTLSDYRDGNFHNIVGMRSGNDLSIYVDGINVKKQTFTIGNITNSEAITIGSSTSNFSNVVFGEVVALNRASTDEEIRNYYELTRKRYGV